jgi:hypothetical protein
LGCRIVDDSHIEYCRFASDDPTEIQAYDCLAVCPADPTDSFWADTFSPDGKAMSMKALRTFFLQIFQLEGMNPSALATESELRAKYPAIEDYLSRWGLRVQEFEWAKLHK